jgi:fatty acid amide hydrolase 2
LTLLTHWYQVDVGSEYTLPAIGLALLEALPRLMPERAKRSVENGDVLKARLEELLGDDGVLILPTYPTTAPAHGMAILPPTNWVLSRPSSPLLVPLHFCVRSYTPHTPRDARKVNTAMWNVMEVPVTAVPLGLDSKGLPMVSLRLDSFACAKARPISLCVCVCVYT